MQFTKLRLSGFKSFVDATDLLIQPGITGIVGPNGCGKSNLVEALRWVMGENSPKRMRGGEMDDVIFAGSASRPARNLADVMLTLDNRDRKAPAQFNHADTLEISRRIERGAGSTYRINGKEVRARDVQLLFADAATGAHSTALVSQGRIGALINAKPADRRTLLEEAAGITGLHSRRHEAELRLRAAESNLERLDDVIATLDSQLQGLKKQARQATRYRNIAAQLRRNEALLLHLEAEAAQAGLATARERLEAAEAAVAEATQGAAEAASRQAEAAAQLPRLREAEAAAAAALQRLLVDRDNLDRELAQAAAERTQAEARLAQLVGDRARAEELAVDARAALERLAQERERLGTAERQDLDARPEAERARDEAAARVAEQESALHALTERVAADEARQRSLEQQIAEQRRRLERLRGQIADSERQSLELAGQRVPPAELEAAETAVAEAERRVEETRREAEAAAERLAEARQAENASREGLQQADKASAKLSAEIDALSALLEPREADMWPPLVDAVTVEPGYETALGAALGDDLSASTDEAAPVHWQALPPYGATRTALPAGVRPLADVVRAPQALARRLTQIGIVPDAATGCRLQAELAPGQRLVTEEGALWRWDGFTAKADAPTGAAQRLEQRNRLAELRALFEDSERERNRAADTHLAARQAAEAATEAEHAARRAMNGALGELDEARQRRSGLVQRETTASSRIAALEESLARLRGELSEAEEALELAERERAALPALEAAREELADLRGSLAERRSALTEAQSRLDRLAREAEARAERLGAIGDEESLWARRAEESARFIAELEERRQQTQAEIERLAGRPDELAGRREALAELIEQAEQKRRDAADALALGETRQADCDRALKAAEQGLAAAREERVRAEAAVEQAEQAQRNLAARVREKLECDLDQVLAVAEIDPSQELPPRAELEGKVQRLVRERDNMGPVNLRAEAEAAELETQIDGMQNERNDLIAAIARLRQGIASLNREGRERLLTAFQEVDRHFSELFVRLFGGGRAHLKLTEAEDPLEAGLEIMASPPGKRLQVMSLLSGGEQALTALALLFAVFLTNPAPICVLDEVDAPLDDANVDRFCTLVDELAHSTSTRFLLITHHRMTMARVDRLFGVTMAERGVSQLVSVDLEAAVSLRESA